MSQLYYWIHLRRRYNTFCVFFSSADVRQRFRVLFPELEIVIIASRASVIIWKY